MRAFERVVDEHGLTVLRVCRALLGPVDADDAWSETFLSALVAYPRLDDGANIEAWLVTIAHRKAIDILRARSRTASLADPDALRVEIPDPADADLDLWRALAALPPKQRQAVAYHHVAGLSHREVASIVGVSPEAARRSSADGIAALRRSYSTRDGAGEPGARSTRTPPTRSLAGSTRTEGVSS